MVGGTSGDSTGGINMDKHPQPIQSNTFWYHTQVCQA